MSPPVPVSEVSRPLAVESIGRDGDTRRTVEVTTEECAALAKRLGLQELAAFRAEMTIERVMGGEVHVVGRVVADVVQTCVVTLDPVPAHVDEDFEVRFTMHDAPPDNDLVIGPGDEEPPEPLTGGYLDYGELAAQQLALALDPWPRLPGAEVPGEARFDPARDGSFAVLSTLRPKSPTEED